MVGLPLHPPDRRGGGIERNPAAVRLLRTLGNVTFLERPFHPTTLVSLAQSALRGRRRQYEARARLEALAHLNETLEARVDAAIAEHKVLADIVESTDALVQVVDPGFRILALNRASAADFERRHGVRPRVGDFLVALLRHKPDEQASLKALWSRALAGAEFTEVARVGYSKAGHRFHEMKFNSLYDRDGRRIGAYQFINDVTDRHEDQERLASTEGALRQAQKMEAVGQLTGGVAHDFNNLLMVFSSGMFLLDQPIDAGRRRRVVEGMRQAVDHGTALTRQLLAFSRRRPLAQKTVDLRDQLLGMQELLQRSLRGDVEVEMTFDDDLLPVDLDPGELELAVLNICVNARDAMPDGGTIRISAGNARSPVLPEHCGYAGVIDRGYGCRHAQGSRGPRLRAVFHDQGGRQGLGARARAGLRLRQPVERPGGDRQPGGQGHDRDAHVPSVRTPGRRVHDSGSNFRQACARARRDSSAFTR